MGFIINLTIALVLFAFAMDIERENTTCEVLAYLKLYFFLVSIKRKMLLLSSFYLMTCLVLLLLVEFNIILLNLVIKS